MRRTLVGLSFHSFRNTWLRNPRVELLSGLVVALALIPEAISFSIIAGVDPKVGLYASFSIAIIISIAGGRSGMISAATGAMALVVVPLVEEHGVAYLFAATVLAGVLQISLGYLGIGALMRFIPRTVMVGFVNALAILIFLAQVPHILLVRRAGSQPARAQPARDRGRPRDHLRPARVSRGRCRRRWSRSSCSPAR